MRKVSKNFRKRKSIWTLLLLSLSIPASLLAQNSEKLRLEIQNERVAFFTLDGKDSLVLTPLASRLDSAGIYSGSELVLSQKGILLGGIWHPASSIESLTVSAFFDGNGQAVKKAQAIGKEDRIHLFEPAILNAGDYLKGSLVVLGSGAKIEGEVGGDVVVFLGDCELGAEAVVHGDVVVIDGEVTQKDGAVVYGQLSRESRQEDHKKRRRFEEMPQIGALAFSGAYNRVDGFNLQLFGRYRSSDSKSKLWGGGGHAFSRDRWLYDVGFSQKLFDLHHFFFGASAYRQTWSQDAWILGKGENSFATLFLRADLMDYTEKEGISIFAEQEYKNTHFLRVTYSVDQFKALDKETDWSLTRGPKRFRRNFSTVPLDTVSRYFDDSNSEIATLTFNYTFDTRNDLKNPDAGWLGKAEWELAGGALGKDQDYSRIVLTFERIQPLWPKHTFLAHAVYGTSIHRLPLQKLFFLGGIGTLRGYRFKQFYGDRMMLVNLEYHARLIDKPLVPTTVGFFDWGKTSPRSGDPEFWSGRPFKYNFGLGAKFGSYLRLDLAKALDGQPFRFTFRFSRNF